MTFSSLAMFCSSCGITLKLKAFKYKEKFYCESDFKRNFLSRCEECSEFITDDCVTIGTLKWHPDCIMCIRCSKSLHRPDKIHVYNENILCQNCMNLIHRKKCFACGKDVTKTRPGLKALGKIWHISCFVCSVS